MINIKQFNLLIKIMKATKCDRFILLKDRIIGSDKDLITLSEVFIDTCIEDSVPYLEFDKEIVTNLEKTVKEYSVGKTKEQLAEVTFDRIMNHVSIKSIRDIDILYSYNSIKKRILNDNIIAYNGDLKADDEFNEILAKKSADGATIYYLNDCLPMSIFTGLLPINKNDKVSATAYNSVYDTNFITVFNIDKGFAIINKYIQYTKI